MTYGVIKTYGNERGLSATFRQWRAESHCRLLHGYSLGFEFTLEAEDLDTRNWVYDFGDFKSLKEWLDNTFDHKLLVAKDDPALDDICALAGIDVADVIILDNVGCEAFAHLAHKQLQAIVANHPAYADRVRLVHTKCFEHASNAGYYRD